MARHGAGRRIEVVDGAGQTEGGDDRGRRVTADEVCQRQMKVLVTLKSTRGQERVGW